MLYWHHTHSYANSALRYINQNLLINPISFFRFIYTLRSCCTNDTKIASTVILCKCLIREINVLFMGSHFLNAIMPYRKLKTLAAVEASTQQKLCKRERQQVWLHSRCAKHNYALGSIFNPCLNSLAHFIWTQLQNCRIQFQTPSILQGGTLWNALLRGCTAQGLQSIPTVQTTSNRFPHVSPQFQIPVLVPNKKLSLSQVACRSVLACQTVGAYLWPKLTPS